MSLILLILCLNLIKQVKDDAELKEIEQGTMLRVLILLLEYVNDPDIEKEVNEISM